MSTSRKKRGEDFPAAVSKKIGIFIILLKKYSFARLICPALSAILFPGMTLSGKGVRKVMKLSARNQFAGTVQRIDRGAVNGIVILDVNGFPVSATISLSAIMIIGWRNQSRIRLISLPNDKFGSEWSFESFARCSL